MNIKASLFTDSNRWRPPDRWIPWYFVLFFAVTCSVLGFFTYLALHTDPGLVTGNAYQKGLNYNHIIAASDQAASLAWDAVIELKQENPNAVLEVTMFSEGKRLDKALVEAWILRPAQDGMDQHWVLHSIGEGKYKAKGMLISGAWNIHVTAMVGDRQKQFSKLFIVP